MNIENSIKLPESGPGLSSFATEAPRTKNQIKATAVADGLAVTAKWKTLVGEARSIWGKLSAEELADVRGNFHKLAGLLQLHYRLSREESDSQVREFFGKHFIMSGSTLRPR